MNVQRVVVMSPSDAAALDFMDKHPEATLWFFGILAAIVLFYACGGQRLIDKMFPRF